jgi:hypothetical protein
MCSAVYKGSYNDQEQIGLEMRSLTILHSTVIGFEATYIKCDN